jgi:hypothetical protein
MHSAVVIGRIIGLNSTFRVTAEAGGPFSWLRDQPARSCYDSTIFDHSLAEASRQGHTENLET